MYTQNDEEKYILEYFKNQIGTFLDIGANDGKTFSNIAALVDNGWKGYCVEPSQQVYSKLVENYKDNLNVVCIQAVISDSNGTVTFLECNDGMLSTLNAELTTVWKHASYTNTTVDAITYKELLKRCTDSSFDFISIDAEGQDWKILQQIDLTDVKMVCIEYTAGKFQDFVDYCKRFGMHKIMHNGENVIMAK